MNNIGSLSKKQLLCFVSGIIAFAVGSCVLSFFGIRKLHREFQKQKLMRENTVIEIAELDIKAPVLEGTERSVLSRGAGHFSGTGTIGSGNYCIAAHSSTIYKEYFNELKNAEKGMEILLYDHNDHSAKYRISQSFIVDPDDTWILEDKGDDRITLVTCTDDGTQRQVVIGMLE